MLKVHEITASVGQVQLLGLEVVAWRYEELGRAGYPPEQAIDLAGRADVDLHVAVGLLAHGATVEQAVRILT